MSEPNVAIPEPTSTPTQSKYPWRAVIRTVVAYVLGFVTVYLSRAIPGLHEVFTQHGEFFVDYFTAAVIAGVGGIWTWVMSIPKVNRILSVIGLSARPKAVEQGTAPEAAK